MPVYKGEINLINFNDGNAEGEAGVGIKSTQVYYAASESGTTPPDLEGVALITDANQLLSFAEIGTTFHVKNEVLYAIKDNEEVGLSVDKGYVIGVAGWMITIPEVAPGNYLWTKTVFLYTDGNQSVSYTVAKQGEKGDRGESSSTYKLKINQSEVLKFIDRQGEMSISPEILTIQLVEENKILEPEINSLEAYVCDINDQKWLQLPSSVISVENEVININLKNFLGMNNDPNLATEASSVFMEKEGILMLQYSHTGEGLKTYVINEYLSIRYGMNKDMASLSLEANGIVSAVQNTKLVFNANGLTVQNGAFKILNNKEESVLYADNDGNLTLVGIINAEGGYFKGDITGASGTFTGRIEAAEGFFSGELSGATGSFSGSISAAQGEIGGFTIAEGKLSSFIKTAEGRSLIILDGEKGIIEAENIILGSGARIKERLVVGENVWLKTPGTSSDSFLSVKNTLGTEILQVRADGTIRAGNNENAVLINGADGSIFSSNYGNTQGWKISNFNSIFNDVTIRGSIKASVLEYGQIQTIGGIIIARPSSRIIEITQEENESILTLESIEGFKDGDWCLISRDLSTIYVKIVSVDVEAKKIVLNNTISEDYVGLPLINFGATGSVGISINGSNNGSFVTPNAISVFEFDEELKTTTPRIILGKLPNEEQYGFAKNSYGLYAENVLLKGSLVTQTDTKEKTTYSGISTLYSGNNSPNSHSYKEWFGENTGEILLWAGAEGTDKESIENSKFFVDRNGNLFAGSGYFRGTIITDATITASEIKTATLTGHGDNPALTIQDANNGIVFLQERKEVFKLTSDSIVANTTEFSFNNKFKINQSGEVVAPKIYISGGVADVIQEGLEKEALVFGENYIGHSSSFKQEEMSGPMDSQMKISDSSIEYLLKNQIAMRLTNQETKINNSLYLADAIKYNDLMEYKPVYDAGELIGYDLFID